MLVATSTPVLAALAAVIYLTCLVILGMACLRKGHWVMFILGIFTIVFWIIGAVMPPTRTAMEAERLETQPPSAA
jgi:hypothetical protein